MAALPPRGGGFGAATGREKEKPIIFCLIFTFLPLFYAS